jgi:hypothetical protein
VQVNSKGQRISEEERKIMLAQIDKRMKFNREWAEKVRQAGENVDALARLEEERRQADADWKSFMSALEGL